MFVIPEGNLRLAFALAFAFAFAFEVALIVVIPEGNLRSALLFVPAVAFLVVIPEGNLRSLHRAVAVTGETMPRREYNFWVYILSNRSHILYIGLTNNLRKRLFQHRQQTPGSFTARYKINRLVYFERYQYVNNAIAREKELKHWTRAQKIALIELANPTWEELMPEAPVTSPAAGNADSLRE